jgi:hypothetical protein
MKVFITDEILRDLFVFIQNASSSAGYIFAYPTMRNSLPGPKNHIFEKYRKERGMKEFNKLIYYLKVKGYIRIKKLAGKNGLILTKEGIDRAIKASFKLDRKRRTDGRWVMLIFDIPNRRKHDRLIIRSALQNLGFQIFQKSVWISPYDVSEKIEKFVQSHNMEDFVRIFLIEEMK